MNGKWYAIVCDLIQKVPDEAWTDPALDGVLRGLCDAQTEAATEGLAGFEISEAIMLSSVGGDEPGRWHDIRG